VDGIEVAIKTVTELNRREQERRLAEENQSLRLFRCGNAAGGRLDVSVRLR
jgi:hypothetical protein